MPSDRVSTRRSRRGMLVLLLVTTVAATGCGTPSAPDDPVVTSLQQTEAPLAAGRAPGRPAAAPVRLRIPAIGVDSTLMDLGLESDGALEVPPDGFSAGWYRGSPPPGEQGPAIIAGHVDWAGQPGVFSELHDLVAGDEIAISRRDGGAARFHVTHVEQFDKDAFPTEAVYGDLDHAGLRLITCGGTFDALQGSYRDNVVVFAELSVSTG